MAKSSINDAVEEMYQSVVAAPKRQRRLRSKTFWAKFDFKNRTKDRVEEVRRALENRKLDLKLDEGAFGTEPKDSWLTLSYTEDLPTVTISPEDPAADPVPTPDESWFALMESRTFESEREVEYYFVVPLLEKLGYVEDDLAIGYPVQMFEGVRKVNKEADFVVFNGTSRDKHNALFILEAKKTSNILSDDATGQARSYATWLNTPYYLVTNGEDVRAFLFRGAVLPDVPILNFKRGELRESWARLYKALNRDAVIALKAHLEKTLREASKIGVPS